MANTINFDISIDLSKGTFSNTEYTNNKLRLSEKEKLPDGTSVYYQSGTWESEVLDMGASGNFDSLSSTLATLTKDKCEIYTKTSSDSYLWTDYSLLGAGGSVTSPNNRYMQIKIIFTAGNIDSDLTVEDFAKDRVEKYQENEYIEFNGNLKLKKEHLYDMSVTDTWSEDGLVLRKTIKKSNFKKINSIEIIE